MHFHWSPEPVILNPLPTAVFAAVMLCWLVFAGAFLLRRKPSVTGERKGDPASKLGIWLQGVGYALVWMLQRRMFTPPLPLGIPFEILLGAVTIGLAAGSVWITLAAIRTLGRQWSFQARLVEGHQLVTDGPYGLVRHPIYTGMFGMLVATGLALSHWVALLPAVLVFSLGMAVRVRSEERLLREAFGADFEEYARRVPAVLPRLL